MKKIILTLLILASAITFVGCTSGDEKSSNELLFSKTSDTSIKELSQTEGDEITVDPVENPVEDPAEDPAEDPTEDPAEDPVEETKTYQEAKEELENDYLAKLGNLDTEYEEKLNALFTEEYITNETRLEELYDLCDEKKKELRNCEDYKAISKELKLLNSKLARYDVESDKYAQALSKKEELLATLSEETKAIMDESEALNTELESLEKYFDEYWTNEEFVTNYETISDEYYSKYETIVEEYYEAMEALKEEYFDKETEHNHGHHGWEDDFNGDCGKGHHGWEDDFNDDWGKGDHDWKGDYNDWFDQFSYEDQINNFLNSLVSWEAPEGFEELTLVEKIKVMLNSDNLVLSDEVKTLLNTILALFNEQEDTPYEEIPNNNNEDLSSLFGYLC